MWVWSLGQEDHLKEGIAIHSSILAWRIPLTEDPGGLQSIWSQRVRHNWRNLTHAHTHTHIWLLWGLGDKESACQCRRCGLNLWSRKIAWTRKSQSTLVFLTGESHGQRSLVCYSPWGRKESDTAQWLNNNNNIYSWKLVLEK